MSNKVFIAKVRSFFEQTLYLYFLFVVILKPVTPHLLAVYYIALLNV